MWKDPVFLTVAVGSSFLFGGLCFGFLRVLTELTLWGSALIALPSGALIFAILLYFQMCSDAPSR